MTIAVARTSREPLLVDIDTDTDPTTLDVYFTLTDPDADPPAITDNVWTAGTWAATPATATRTGWRATARLIIGPGSVHGALAPGWWRLWVWIDGDIDPVKRSGDIHIT